MNERIRIQKDYQKQLEILLDSVMARANQAEQELLNNVPESFLVAIQHQLFVIKPLHAIVFFVCVLKNVGWYMDQLEDVNEKRFRLGDAFDVLKSLPNETAMVILNTIECNEADYGMMIEAFEDNDKDSFVSVLKQSTGVTKFSKICKFFYDLSNLECLADEVGDEDSELLVDAVNEAQASITRKMGIEDDQDYCRLADSNKELLDSLFYEEDVDLERTAKALSKTNAKEMYLFVEAYQQNYDTFTSKEKALVENIIYNPEHPEIKDWYEKNLAIYKKNNGIEEPEEQEETVEEFHLPENFSKMITSDKWEEHFTGTSLEIREGKNLEELVSYLVQNTYIENNPDVMRLFVYRLTGRWRPKMKELPQICWNGGIDASPNELIYIIQKATDGHQKPGKYDKMKMYFTGPKFPDNPKSVADNAKIEFRRYLVRLYPNIFKLRPTESEE